MNSMAVVATARTILDRAISCLAPPRCRLCHCSLFDHANPFLCPACCQTIPWIGDGACRGCGYPAGPHASHGDHCYRCRGGRLNLTAAAAVARYRGGVCGLIRSLKFRRETEVARPMASLMGERLAAVGFSRLDLILPVALHPARLRQRGFDQAVLLARFLAAATGLPAPAGLVLRVRNTQAQTMLRRDARLQNLRNAFAASPALAGTRILLVDDVMTTGATIAECARACREAGARRVYALVFAR